MASSEGTTINTASGINLLAGIWLIIAPFILQYSIRGASIVNDVIVGILVGILAVIRITNHRITWPSWLNLILAFWLIVSPFILGYAYITQVMWNDILLGVIVGILSITSAVSSPAEMIR